MASVPVIAQQILDADKGTTGKPGWNGVNGFKAILLNLLGLTKTRGIMVVPDIKSMSLLGAVDTQLVLVKGQAMYQYDGNGTTINPNDVVASGGGVWKFLGQEDPADFREVIGNSVATAFNINHKLGTVYPTVHIFDTLNNLPYSNVVPDTIVVLDADTIQVTFLIQPPSLAYTVVVKK